MSQSPPARRALADDRPAKRQWSGDRRNYDTHGKTTTERGYGADWQAFVVEVIAEDPLCVDCEHVGRTRPVDECHHVIPIKYAPELRLERSNVAGLCRECHERWEKEGPPDWWPKDAGNARQNTGMDRGVNVHGSQFSGGSDCVGVGNRVGSDKGSMAAPNGGCSTMTHPPTGFFE